MENLVSKIYSEIYNKFHNVLCFETESDCDKKLSELNDKQKVSEDNPILDPFSQFNRWWKVRKRVAL